MKQRIITAVIGLIIFAGVMLFFDTFLFNLVMSIATILVSYELLSAYKMPKALVVISCMFAGIMPLIVNTHHNGLSVVAIMVYVAIILAYSLKNFEKITVSQTATAFFLTIVYTFSLISFIYIRDLYPVIQSLYFVLLAFACAWGTDSGAYFVGRFFGKKKLSPKLSPNKTIEGFIGGLFSGVIICVIISLIFGYFYNIQINYFVLIPLTFASCLIGVYGDLFASMIKRQCGIKDFGYIMPGHGGMMDRFDSVLFCAPFFFISLQFVQKILIK
ncbi:MAG: phosphatidate cytidylyltransferase [Oscillospiraceae bacterium]